MSTIRLRFVNSDAKPKEAIVHCDADSVPNVMAWYGAYYAGDRYAVLADGEKLTKDRNGELVTSRTCTCPYDERPHPCQRRYALAECQVAALLPTHQPDTGRE